MSDLYERFRKLLDKNIAGMQGMAVDLGKLSILVEKEKDAEKKKELEAIKDSWEHSLQGMVSTTREIVKTYQNALG